MRPIVRGRFAEDSSEYFQSDLAPSCEFWDEEFRLLADVLSPIGVRRHVAAQRSLFAYGEAASSYFLLEAGKLLICRRPDGGKPVVRWVQEGSLFLCDCDGMRAADCEAVVDSVLFCFDRRQLEQYASLDPVLRRTLRTVHATDLSMILRGLGMAHPREEQARKVERKRRAPRVSATPPAPMFEKAPGPAHVAPKRAAKATGWVAWTGTFEASRFHAEVSGFVSVKDRSN